MLYSYLLVIALTASASLAEPYRIPLMRMTSPLKYLIANAHKPRYAQLIQDLEALKDSNHTVPLFKFLDYEFYGKVLIGHQPFNVVFDTTWADLWVPSILCSAVNIACAFRNKYDSTESATYVPQNKSYNMNIGKYKLSGKVSMDFMKVGGLSIDNQTFAEIENLPWREFMFSKADGVFGLSFETYASEGIIPFFYNLMKQKRISNQVFSLYLNRDLITKKGGSLLLGDIDKKHFVGNLSYVTVDPKSGFWEIPVDKISMATHDPKVRNVTFCNDGCFAIIDSSSNEIRGPPEDIDRINGILKARRFLFGRSVVDCGIIPTLPHLTITIGNIPYILKGKNLAQTMNYGPTTICLSSFSRYETSGPAKWLIGGAFLSRYYTVFDMQNSRVGFARAV